MGIKSFINNWKIKRAERVEMQRRLNELFELFLNETRPLTPKAPKNAEAALYRHAWKRAVVISLIFDESKDSEKHDLYSSFARLAAEKYNRIAPIGPYGRIRLKITPEVAMKMLEAEERKFRVSAPRITLSKRIDNLI